MVHSGLDGDLVRQCLLTPGDMQNSVGAWLEQDPRARIAVIKNANSSFFYQNRP